MSKFVRRGVTIALSVIMATFLIAGGAMAQPAEGDECYPVPPGGCIEVGGDTKTPRDEEPKTDVGGGTTVTPPKAPGQPQTQVLGTSTTPSTVVAQQGLAATGIDAGVIAVLAVIALLGGAGLILIGRKRA